jgi:hypothetical protein
MSKSNKDNGKKTMIEAYYKMIGEAHIDNLIEELESKKNEVEKVQVPHSLEDWFVEFERKRALKQKRKIWVQRMKKISVRAAVYLVFLIAFLTVVTLSVDAFRNRVFNYFLEKNEVYTEIEKREEDSNQVVPDIEAESFYYFSYLPPGYRYEKHTLYGDAIMIKYTNGEETILFDQDKGEATYQLDTEDAEVREVPIGNSNGQLIIKGDRTMLFWYNEDTSFLIKAYISEQEILKMAESLEKNK